MSGVPRQPSTPGHALKEIGNVPAHISACKYAMTSTGECVVSMRFVLHRAQ